MTQDKLISYANVWAKKYIQNKASLVETACASDPTSSADKLLLALRFASAQAWGKVEGLLAEQVPLQRLNQKLINPWKIAEDSHQLFERLLESYTKQETSARFAVTIGSFCAELRQRYTSQEPRLLGFFSMQFHYTGQLLLEQLAPNERQLIGSLLKVADDHVYMPLHRTYEAAAQEDFDSPVLRAVQQLLPHITVLSEGICADVVDQYPNYQSFHGSLTSIGVRNSTVRDVEMFHVYLCLCVLEGSLQPVQEELFPLCVMLYPALKVNWALIRRMLALMGKKLEQLLGDEFSFMADYLVQMQGMFADDVLPDSDPVWTVDPDTVRFVDKAWSITKDLKRDHACIVN